MQGTPKLSRSTFTDLLHSVSVSVGIPLDADEAERFFIHTAALLEWNARFNITAITTIEDIIDKHIVDSLLVCSHVRLQGTLADMGSGGGFPGIPLKIHNPALSVMLIEANRKKANFLREVIRQTGLKDITIFHGRVESPHVPGGFDWVIARAFRDIETVCAYALPLAKKRGGLVYMQGGAPLVDETLPGRLNNAWEITRTHAYQLPHNKGQRHLLVLRRGDHAPQRGKDAPKRVEVLPRTKLPLR
jgi:16S rRNA (guanine527-N7)-methyltransferase